MADVGYNVPPERVLACGYAADIDVQAGARASAFLGSYILSAFAVVFLSTPRLRRQWAFRILVVALMFAISKCIVELKAISDNAKGLVNERSLTPPPLFFANGILQWYTPWICDGALLFKLLAFHPAAATPWKKRAGIIAFPLVMYLPRLPLLIAASVLTVTVPPDNGGEVSIATRTLITEGAMHVALNSYCSAFLLYKAHQFARADYAVSRRAQHARLGLRFFAESILFTFLPATVIQIAWLLVASLSLRLPDPDGKLARADSYLRMLNSSFSVNFGLLAVWWATARIHAQNVGGTGSTQQKSDGDGKRNALDMSMINWALGPLEPERRTSGTSRILKQSSPAGRVHPVSRVDEVKSGGDQVEEIKSLPTEQEEGQEEDSDSRRRKATNGI